MEQIFNPDCLTYEEIERFVTRVKILIINELNQLLLCKINGTYYFVGAHVEEEESLVDALKREVLEETGINLDVDDSAEPFLVYRYFNKNHYGTGVKCLSTINYYSIKTNKLFDLDNRKLDSNESKKDFTLEYVNLDEVERKLLSGVSTLEQEALAKEMIDIITCFKTKPKALVKELGGRCNE